ncbi:class I SAM-dependent methyltransferase [Hoeflea prorocentri]|uniref:Class I SAM-dependent methyltransferase n=1 Tax=Hoeflea prorocentri TaxID=1922333 RepID=A0A9X3ZJA3_9HYPH|nr:class I SAM-dependent methyltransferase [Hoeflea prorocentri]MCY6382858.1 class I SAM-dependent methyltransferase [Hoeflea prorocentri]MDA5400658.1 class I SAM-dependent methyltransferase [Hoeflea prorocentri]
MTRDYLSINKDIWNADAANWVDFAKSRWSLETPEWGTWGNSEASLRLLPADMTGVDAIELGCGTGYVSGWMNRRGARVTAIDVSAEQLATARHNAEEHSADITFIEGNAEETGLPDASFDFAISEYGASIWCAPDKWLREAWRLLRPNGRLVFLGNHPLSLICSPLDGSPAERTLHRPYREMWGADWTEVEFEPTGVCFNLTMSSWMDLFTDIGFAVTKYQELYAPEGEMGTRAAIPADWAKSYPVEQVWHLTKHE